MSLVDVRCKLRSEGIAELDDYLDRRVGAIGLCFHSDVVSKILRLNESPSAGFSDYGAVIRTDAGLSARLLKIVNSAYYAQRRPITNLDRACVLLGIERLKAFTLGYFLSNSAADRSSPYSRIVWGESVFRACLACELARAAFPMLVTEAFVVGLMLDAGLGLMPTLLPHDYPSLQDANLPPREIFEREFTQLEFTHTDVVRTLLRQWKLPQVLAFPIEHHHELPDQQPPTNPVARLHRIAYVVGQTDCRGQLSPQESTPVLPARGADLLGLPQERIHQAVLMAMGEYKATVELFADVAAKVPDPEALATRIKRQLAESVESMLERGGGAGPEVIERFMHEDTVVEVRQQGPGAWIAYLCDAQGNHLAQVTFQQRTAQVRAIRESLGLTPQHDPFVQLMLDRVGRRSVA